MAENQPLVILPEGYTRTIGRDAQRNNILAARIIAETIRTTLGPKGMDKMLVDNLGDVIITNDGVTILKEMQVEHPAAKMIIEVAKTQEEEVGDGTTTAVVIAGELLKRAEELLDQNIHPSVIARGYHMASKHAVETLRKISIKVDPTKEETMKKIVKTAMIGKNAEANEHLVDLIVRAVKQVSVEERDKIVIDTNNIKIEKRVGGGIEDSELVEGVVLDKERVHPNMPKSVENARIALVNDSLEIEKTEIDAQLRIDSPEQMEAFIKQEESMLKKMADKVRDSGANVLFCQKGIDDVVQHYLAKYGIFAVRRVSESDMKKLSKATGAKIITNLDDLEESVLGRAGLVEEKKIGTENMVFVEKCTNAKAVTLLIRGGTEHVIDEVGRAVEDALGDLKTVLKSGRVVAGGGAPEVEAARELRKYATKVGGREQLAIESFADSLEVIPKTLAENAGLDPIDMLVELRATHEKGDKWAGVDLENGEAADMEKKGILEPLMVKIQAIKSAAEAAVMILRIDDVIAASKLAKDKEQQNPEFKNY
ncbi:thermosome subunit [Nanoarchaeota archaeon]|nr:MAG: thermosome subunit [Nanoarchaeota archaeon]